ncbi:hypothetical protein Tco_0110128 [Tanacetum coccineum]
MATSMEARIAEYVVALTAPSPPPSPLTLLSSPLSQIPSPPLPLPSPPTHTSPTYVEAPLGYRVVRIRLRATSPLPLLAPSSPLLLRTTGCREDVPEVDVLPWKSQDLLWPVELIMDDRAAVRAEIEVLRTERRAYKRERVMRPDVDDHATRDMMRIHVLEHRAHIDTLEDISSSA